MTLPNGFFFFFSCRASSSTTPPPHGGEIISDYVARHCPFKIKRRHVILFYPVVFSIFLTVSGETRVWRRGETERRGFCRYSVSITVQPITYMRTLSRREVTVLSIKAVHGYIKTTTNDKFITTLCRSEFPIVKITTILLHTNVADRFEKVNSTTTVRFVTRV